MIETISNDTYLVTCDKCDWEQEFQDCYSWANFLEEFECAGWTKKVGKGEWRHYCSDCSQ